MDPLLIAFIMLIYPLAVSFVTFLVSSDGQRILQSQGLDYIKPIAEGKQDKIPIAIKNMISMTNVAYT